LGLPEIIWPAEFWIILALFGASVTPYIPAAAQQKGYMDEQLRGGIMSRGERVILMLVSLFLAIIYPDYIYTTYVIIILAVFSNLSAIQRFAMVIIKNNDNCK
jgi:phosphatidylglycerophosphate synthase